ncbi:MAG: hypothetical protein C00003105_00561 [ANME-2 cluster archaeon HR1]|nr:MAG: hypothetical protein C00003105_00561 [ANME-2 cluster archaeon HR1]
MSFDTRIDTPGGRRFNSSSTSLLIPSSPLLIAFKSLGLVIFIMIWVLHWLNTFLSIRAGRWLITIMPIPNFLPSEAMVRSISVLAVFSNPLSGQKL